MAVRTVVLALYFGCLALLTLYGAHRWYLLWLFRRHRGDAPQPPARFDAPPTLTVQIPLYNEMYVAKRVIDAVSALDWPKERLDIQVLDDSIDETTAIVADTVAQCRARALDIVHLRRGDRCLRRLAARHADGRPGPVVSRPATRLEVHLPERPGRPG